MPSLNYDDIINLPYPNEDWNFRIKHPRMSIENRAKLFSPFAALRGHKEKISNTAEMHLSVSRENLIEDGIAELEEIITQLNELLKENIRPKISVTFFAQSKESSEGIGTYKKIIGHLKKIDMLTRVLFLESLQIPLLDIKKIVIIS